MGLFNNIRQDVLDEFAAFVTPTISTQELFIGKSTELCFVINDKYKQAPKTGNCRENVLFEALEQKRWGYTPVCPFCKCEKAYEMLDQRNWRCANYECRRDFNVLNGTLLHNTKLPINVWYDVVAAYRKDKKFSARALAKELGISQKTCWLTLTKIKVSPFVNEEDYSIMQVLLTPKYLTKNIPAPNRLTLDKTKSKNLQTLKQLYINDPILNSLFALYIVLESTYKWDTKKMCSDMKVNHTTVYRWLNGARRVGHKHQHVLDNFIRKTAIDKFGQLTQCAA